MEQENWPYSGAEAVARTDLLRNQEFGEERTLAEVTPTAAKQAQAKPPAAELLATLRQRAGGQAGEGPRHLASAEPWAAEEEPAD